MHSCLRTLINEETNCHLKRHHHHPHKINHPWQAMATTTTISSKTFLHIKPTRIQPPSHQDYIAFMDHILAHVQSNWNLKSQRHFFSSCTIQLKSHRYRCSSNSQHLTFWRGVLVSVHVSLCASQYPTFWHGVLVSVHSPLLVLLPLWMCHYRPNHPLWYFPAKAVWILVPNL